MLSVLIWNVDFSHFPAVVTWLPSFLSINISMAIALMSPSLCYLDCINLSTLIDLKLGLMVLVEISTCSYKFCSNTFFPRTSHLWNYLPFSCFPFTYSIRVFKCKSSDHLWSSRNLFYYCLLFSLKNSDSLSLPVTPCGVVALSPCID